MKWNRPRSLGGRKTEQCTAKRWQTSCVKINFQASSFGVENEGSVKIAIPLDSSRYCRPIANPLRLTF